MKKNFLLLLLCTTCFSYAAPATFTDKQLDLPGKKGVCFTMRATAKKPGGNTHVENAEKIKKLNVDWYYSWGAKAAESHPKGIEFVPMVWGGGGGNPEGQAAFYAGLKRDASQGKIRFLLAFNEPDRVKQSNMSVDKAIALWPLLESVGVPLCSPSAADPGQNRTDQDPNGDWVSWMRRFMEKAEQEKLRVDYIGVHHYGNADPASFKRKMTAIYQLYKRPILITEFAVVDWKAKTMPKAGGNYSKERVLAFAKDILPWMESTPWIKGYAWFSFPETSIVGGTSALFKADGKTLTPLGEYYAKFKTPTRR